MEVLCWCVDYFLLYIYKNIFLFCCFLEEDHVSCNYERDNHLRNY
jgi:hypothetical protein